MRGRRGKLGAGRGDVQISARRDPAVRVDPSRRCTEDSEGSPHVFSHSLDIAPVLFQPRSGKREERARCAEEGGGSGRMSGSAGSAWVGEAEGRRGSGRMCRCVSKLSAFSVSSVLHSSAMSERCGRRAVSGGTGKTPRRPPQAPSFHPLPGRFVKNSLSQGSRKLGKERKVADGCLSKCHGARAPRSSLPPPRHTASPQASQLKPHRARYRH